MKRKYRAYLRLNIMSIFFLAVSFISMTLAWFAYSGFAKVETDIKVKSWYIEFQKDKQKVSNDVVISLDDIYPGMDPINETIDIKNRGDSDALVSYSISSVRLFNNELNIKDYSKGLLEDKISHEYPFHININLNKKYVKAADDTSQFNFSITWPFDSENDHADSDWGTEAFNFQKQEEEKLKANPDYQVRTPIRIVISLKAEQYLTSNEASDIDYNLGDTILYDVKSNKVCNQISTTCLKTYVIDVDNKVGMSSVNLLPDLYDTYAEGSYNEYESKLNSLTAGWNVSTQPLKVADLLKIVSTDIVNSNLVREGLSDRVIGNMNYEGRLEKEILQAKEKSGSYEFLNNKFPFLATNKCYWINDEYDSSSAFALTKKNSDISNIFKETKSRNCGVVPIISVSKANLM